MELDELPERYRLQAERELARRAALRVPCAGETPEPGENGEKQPRRAPGQEKRAEKRPKREKEEKSCNFAQVCPPDGLPEGAPESERRFWREVVAPGLVSGEIVQVLPRRRFLLLEAAEYCGIKLPQAHYTPDFILQHKDGTVEVVEVKSRFTRRMQRDYIYRRRLFIETYAQPGGWRFTEWYADRDGAQNQP